MHRSSWARSTRMIPFCGVILCAYLGLEVQAFAARKRVVVMRFSGPGAARAYRGVIQALRRRSRLVTTRAYLRAARRARIRPTAPAAITQVCAKLRCDAVVTGQVRRARGRYQLTIAVHDASTGDLVGQREARVRAARRLSGAGAQLGRSALRLIARTQAPLRSDKAVAARPPPVSEPSGAQEREPSEEPPPRAPSVNASDAVAPPPMAEEEAESSSGRAREDARVSAAAGTDDTLETFAVGAGLGFAIRSYELATADETSSYDGGAYPEFVLDAAVYPLARVTSTFARHLGLGLAYSRHLSISTEDTSGSQAASDVETSSQQFLVDARVRWFVLARAWSPVVFGAVGWGFRDFDLAANDVLTSFNYQFVRISADVAVPLGTPYISLEVGFDIRPLIGVGQDAVNAYGERTGGLAWAARVGAFGELPLGFFYFGRFEYLHFGMDFAGRTDLGADQVREVDRIVPSSGSDTFLRFWLGAGYAL